MLARSNRAIARDPCNVPAAYDQELTPDQQAQLQDWIASHIAPAHFTYRSATSNGLRYIFERQGGFYVTNGQFKGAMLAAGYTPVRHWVINWYFRIKPQTTGALDKEKGEIRA